MKAGTECVHTAHLGGNGKPPGESNRPAHHAPKASGHSAPFQQHTPVSDRQLSESSQSLSSTQPAPQRQNKSWGSSGPHRPEDKEPLPPWHMFTTPAFSRSHLGFPKPSSHEDARGDHTAGNLEVCPEATLAAPPVSERTPQRSSRAPSDATTTFELVDKVLDLDGRSFYPLSSPVLHDTARAVHTTGTTTATSAHPHHMLQYSQAEPLTPSSYFNTTTGSTMTSGGPGSQDLRDQLIQQQQHHQSVSGGSSVTAQDNCLHLLSQLSSKFLMDFGKAGAGDWTTVANDSNNNNNNNHLNSTISKLFDGLQIFLKTVERLRPASSLENLSSGSECSYSDLCDESEYIGLIRDGQMQMHSTAMAIDHVHGGSSTENTSHQRNRGVIMVESVGLLPTDDAVPQPLDMPTTLTILTCYTWLLKGYEMVLSGIHEILASQDRLQGLQSLPAIVHGARIGSFGLEDHPDMQIEMVIHIGWQLLQRIEGALGVQVVSEIGKGGLGGSSRDSPSSQGGGGGAAAPSTTSDERRILDPKSAAAVLDSWFTNASSRGSSGGNGTDEGRRVEITRTIAKIRNLLRGYWRDNNGKNTL